MNPERRNITISNLENVTKEERPNIPLSEIEVNPEKFNVIAGLTETRNEGRDVSKYLVSKSLGGKRIVVMGEPSTGKSSVLYQLVSCVKENAERIGIPFNPELGLYDIELAREKQKRRHNDGMGNLEGEAFNKRLVDVFMQSTHCEVPGVGLKDERDRGRSAVETIMENIGKGYDNDSILVALPCNRSLQIYGSLLRPHIASLNPDEVFDNLEIHGVNIVGLPKTERVARIIQAMFEKMGKEEHIRKIRDEEREIISSWSLIKEQEELKKIGDVDYDIFKERSHGMNLPPTGSEKKLNEIYRSFGIGDSPSTSRILQFRDMNARIDTLQQAIKMEDDFRNVYGVDKDRGIVAYNPMQSSEVVIDLSPFFEVKY